MAIWQMCWPIAALSFVSRLRSRSNRPANGLSMTAAAATLRNGGSICCPASSLTSSKKVSVRLICMPRSPDRRPILGLLLR